MTEFYVLQYLANVQPGSGATRLSANAPSVCTATAAAAAGVPT